MMDAKNSSKKFVLDASVLIKWFADNEEYQIQANELKEDYKSSTVTLLTPALVSWEMGNFLGRIYPEEEAIQSFNIFKNYNITSLMLSLEGTSLAFMIMKKCSGVSFYDASYHALAMQYEATFLTDDRKYYENAKKLGNIMLLKDY